MPRTNKRATHPAVRPSSTIPVAPPVARHATAPVTPASRASYITLHDIAARLETTVDRIHDLIKHNYLRPLSPDTVVLPPPAAMDWLTQMLRPLPMRPLIRTTEVASILVVPESTVRRLCLGYGIQLQLDPVFGELMTLAGFHKFIGHLHGYRDPDRFDRAGLLWWMTRTLKSHPRGGTVEPKAEMRVRVKPLPYSARLDREISRILQLKEPERTIMSVKLWTAYRDADNVSDCVHRYAEAMRERGEIDRRVEWLMKRIRTDTGEGED